MGGGKGSMTDPKESNANGRLRRKFDETYKRRAVELSESGDRTVGEIAHELGISADMLYRWRVEYGVTTRRITAAPPGPRSVSEVECENRELRAKLADMEVRETILKKSLGILSPAPGSGMPKWKR
jgi:transposase-like protein